jgi:hypothetical protein
MPIFPCMISRIQGTLPVLSMEVSLAPTVVLQTTSHYERSEPRMDSSVRVDKLSQTRTPLA